MLPAGVLRVSSAGVAWHDVAARLRPFVARRVAPAEIDDVLQDIFVRMQRGLPALRDDDRFTSWLFQVARSAIAEHARTRARHPLAAGDPPDEPAVRRASSNLLLWVSLGVFALAIAVFVGLRISFDQQVADVSSRVDKLAH